MCFTRGSVARCAALFVELLLCRFQSMASFLCLQLAAVKVASENRLARSGPTQQQQQTEKSITQQLLARPPSANGKTGSQTGAVTSAVVPVTMFGSGGFTSQQSATVFMQNVANQVSDVQTNASFAHFRSSVNYWSMQCAVATQRRHSLPTRDR